MRTDQDAFATFLASLEPSCGTAAQRQAQLRRKLIEFFTLQGCDYPEELADETIETLAKKVNRTENDSALTADYDYVFSIAEGIADRQQQFAYLLITLQPEPELESFADRYLALRSRIIRYFSHKRCGEDSDYLADETIVRLVRNINKGVQIDNPASFVFGIAKKVFSRYVAGRIKARSEITTPTESEPLREHVHDCLREAMAKLSPENREMFIRYYAIGEDADMIAEEYGITVGTMMVRFTRNRRKLQKWVRECLQRSLRYVSNHDILALVRKGYDEDLMDTKDLVDTDSAED